MRLRIQLDPTDAPAQLIDVHRSVLHHHTDRRDPEADLTIRGDGTALKAVLAGLATLDDQVARGSLELVGDVTAFERLVGLLDEFRTWFPIVEP
jgi:alkyl sulfatase BDS1-like metallo-beta-lactamase superfamily hydrolase